MISNSLCRKHKFIVKLNVSHLKSLECRKITQQMWKLLPYSIARFEWNLWWECGTYFPVLFPVSSGICGGNVEITSSSWP